MWRERSWQARKGKLCVSSASRQGPDDENQEKSEFDVKKSVNECRGETEFAEAKSMRQKSRQDDNRSKEQYIRRSERLEDYNQQQGRVEAVYSYGEATNKGRFVSGLKCTRDLGVMTSRLGQKCMHVFSCHPEIPPTSANLILCFCPNHNRPF